MVTPKVIVLRAPGTNCDLETEYAFLRAGANCERVHVQQLVQHPELLFATQILCLPGGFSYGDDLAAGRILAAQIRHYLAESLQKFKASGKLILGICNGFQVLLQTGLLLEENRGPAARATLTDNDSGRFEDRWVHLQTNSPHCVFLGGIGRLYLPVAHAEGKFVARDARVLDDLQAAGQLALKYTPPVPDGPATYPENPNGSQRDVAGLCDTTGRVFGLMPHPERYIDRTQHPRWTRETLPEAGDGMKLFQNAVDYFR